ncbi:ABC transporter permease [Pigmentiphaga kullae]|uniref:Amino acid/amide ABC transporter membrane protein 1 (HAAT family) /amino acid/amide ABC transporter membrane protein 2 (HAAT family) n=1 Tax=Pigmentiphaga kullae TaxID=151784 RepID=A0A4Q7NMN2_9BURK|nr:ABC transporter permease [Pigmentiphaga kullae]RZS86439.1 amino acid/amide ABC transporter membrane protein 1 (HAAT family) /amino acid/amide ABC transporter membrane protein 2 (HAAT family) [Pigmentiphaga kullae]
MLELFASQILNGLAIGQVYALIALGFSLVFGVSNLINFAQGALFMLGAFIAFTGVAVLQLPLPVAATGSVLIVALLGMLLERVALRPLENAPYIAPVLSTLAISLIIEQLAEIIWSPESQSFPLSFDEATYYFGNAYITSTDLLIFGFGALATLALTLFLSRSWWGRALRATAQDRDAAAQLGVRTGSVRQLAFALAGALGALSGVLVALYFKSVFPQMGLPFGLKGFAAALLGGLTSTPGAVLGGLLLGVVETLASAYIGEGSRDLVAFCLVLVFLVFRPHGLLGDRRLDALGGASGAAGAMPTTSVLASSSSQRGAVRAWELPPWGFLAVAAVLALLPALTQNAYFLQAVVYAMIFALLVASVTLVSGALGVLSIGHTAFYGVGAYAVGLLARNLGWPAEAALIGAAAVTACVAVVAALPLLKLSGHTAALGTLAVGQIGYLVFMSWLDVTRGPMGFIGIPAPRLALLGGLPLSSLAGKFWLVAAVAGIALFLAQRLLDSGVGRAWRGIREDRLAAHTAGLPVRRYLLVGFACSGLLAGLAGGLFAYVQSVVSPESFTVSASILLLTIAVLGGLGNLTGAALAGFALTLLPELLRPFAEWRMVAYGLALLLMLRLRPHGLLGAR